MPGTATTVERAPGPAGAGYAELLRVEGVSKRFGSRRVLECADLSLLNGEVVSITGRNGVGKTTLLRIVAGLLAPDSGSVKLAGLTRKRNRREYQRRVGLLAAGNSGLYGRLAVDHHLDFWARLALIPLVEIPAAIARVAQAFELEELRGMRVDRLSMGQRQRLRLALSLLPDPPLALLDEPATSLDAEALALLDAELAARRGRGLSALICAPGTPDWTATDRDVVMAQGRLEPA